MIKLIKCFLLVAVVCSSVQSFSLQHDPERLPAGLSPGLSRVGHASRLEGRLDKPDARLPLPTPQELEAIRKVAQLLAMLGEQVIPAIIGETPGKTTPATPEVPNDPVVMN